MKNWSRIVYAASVLLLVAGVILKISKKPGWEILFIAAAAAMGINLLLDRK